MKPAGSQVRDVFSRVSAFVILAAAVGACSASAPSPEPAPAARPAAALALKVLGEATTQGPRITVRVLSVERAAPEAIVVKFLLVNPDASAPARVGSLFSGTPGGEGSLSGICLVDDSLKKRYFVMRDDRDQVQCTTGLGEIPAGGRVEAWARLAAPPADVRQVTLLVPGVPPFTGLPIADLSPGTGPARASY